ncbi:MAG TPA: DUF2855 family protein [Caldimonas sp.]
MPATVHVLEIAKANLAARQMHEEPLPEALVDGELVVEIEHVALSANTLTYAAMGRALGYWSLFPASAPELARVPAWGHAQVLASRAIEIEPGARLFGLLPIASHVRLQGRRSRLGLRETSRDRAALNPVYNQYALRPSNGTAAEATELELRALLHPLFITSFVLAHELKENRLHGSGEVVVVSASSKTALGLAYELRGSVPLTALTGERNAAWLATSGFWDRVVGYESLASLGSGAPCVLVDFSGDPELVARVMASLGRRCVRRVDVGATHSGTLRLGASEEDALFSGPATIERLVRDWGAAAFERQLEAALRAFGCAMRPHIEVRHADGPAAVQAAYEALRRGGIAPSTALIARPGRTSSEQ